MWRNTLSVLGTVACVGGSVLLAGFTATASRAQTQYDGGRTYSISSGIYGDIELGKTISSVLNVSGSANVSGVFIDRGSTTNVAGGFISYVGVNYYDALFYGNTTSSGSLNVTSGSVNVASTFNKGVTTVSGGRVSTGSAQGTSGSTFRVTNNGYAGTASTFGTGRLEVNGAGAVVATMNVNESGTASLINGNIGLVNIGDNGVYTQTGGNVTDVRMTGNGVFSFRGGTVSPNTIYAYELSTIDVVGLGVNIGEGVRGVDATTGSSGTYYALSVLFNASPPINTRLFDADGGYSVYSSGRPLLTLNGNRITAAPEPNVLLLMPIGAVLLYACGLRRQPVPAV